MTLQLLHGYGMRIAAITIPVLYDIPHAPSVKARRSIGPMQKDTQKPK
jgi:hypothetical protein